MPAKNTKAKDEKGRIKATPLPNRFSRIGQVYTGLRPQNGDYRDSAHDTNSVIRARRVLSAYGLPGHGKYVRYTHYGMGTAGLFVPSEAYTTQTQHRADKKAKDKGRRPGGDYARLEQPTG